MTFHAMMTSAHGTTSEVTRSAFRAAALAVAVSMAFTVMTFSATVMFAHGTTNKETGSA